MNGIDVSNYNPNINWNNVINSGFSLVYIKATEGTTFVDPLLNNHYVGALNVGMKIGFYHFLSSKSAPETQAENFYNNIKDKRSDLKPCLDIEITGIDINDFTRRFIRKFSSLTDMPIIIYASSYYARDNIANDIKQAYPLWVANYGINPWQLKINTGFSSIIGHQYTDKGNFPGINGVFDLDVFNDNIFISKKPEPRSYVHNEKIRQLQVVCNNTINAGLVADSYWGPLTDAAVRRLPLAGLKYRTPELTVWIQLRLGLNPDGIFGSKTQKSVIWWQQRHSLAVDGIVGYNTLKSLAFA